MNWEAIKKIYVEVLVCGAKIEYLGEDKYKITRYYLNGQKRWEFEYKNGLLHGEGLLLATNGTVLSRGKYLNGDVV